MAIIAINSSTEDNFDRWCIKGGGGRINVTFVLNCIYTGLQDFSADKKAEGRKMSVLINRLQMYHPLLTHGHVWTPSASRSYFTCDPMQALHREHSVSKSTCYSKNIAANIWKPQCNLPQPVALLLINFPQLRTANYSLRILLPSPTVFYCLTTISILVIKTLFLYDIIQEECFDIWIF